MISKIKKNQINLFKLKKYTEMISIEKKFYLFLKKMFVSKEKNKSKFFIKNKICACGHKFGKKSSKFYIAPFNYIDCAKCNTISISPMISDKGLEKIYSNNGIYSIYQKQFVTKKSKKFLRQSVINKRKAEQVLSLFKQKNFDILDVGCGDGGFLRSLRQNNVKNLFGVDKRFTSILEEGKIFYSNAPENFKKKFNCITLWGVLEHVNKPTEFLKYISKFLKKSGFLILEFPSSDSMLMQYIKTIKFDAPRFLEKGRHLFFFSKKYIHILSKKLGLALYDLETNGLDLQTIIGHQTKINEREIFFIQKILDDNLISDHYRVVLKKF